MANRKPSVYVDVSQVNVQRCELISVYLFRERNNFDTSIQLHLSVEEDAEGRHPEPRVMLYVNDREIDVLAELSLLIGAPDAD